MSKKIILSVKDLEIKFLLKNKFYDVIKTVSLDIYEDEIISIIGESGSGKSVITKSLSNISEENCLITNGNIFYNEEDFASYYKKIAARKVLKKYIKLESDQVRVNEYKKYLSTSIFKKHEINKLIENKIRGNLISYIPQDPMQSLNPLLTIGNQLIETIRLHDKTISKKDAIKKAISLLEEVGINDAEKCMKSLPMTYSGGMRQRVVIAIAIASNPKILIADEPTTALDCTIQNLILDILLKIKKNNKMSIIFVTHDLSVASYISDRIAIFYSGTLLEIGTKEEIFLESIHPYTWALLSSLPQVNENSDEEMYYIPGNPPMLGEEIKGDVFAKRNPNALEIDFLFEPPVYQITDTHFVKTWSLHEHAQQFDKPVQLKKVKELYYLNCTNKNK